jgi:hypothetical protein
MKNTNKFICYIIIFYSFFVRNGFAISVNSSIDLGIQVESISISTDNKYLFASGWRGDSFSGPHFQIFDISAPTTPVLVGSTSTPTNRGSIGYITISDDLTKAYLSSVSDGLLTIDISNPQAPSLDSAYYPGFNSTHRVSLSGNLAYFGAGDYGLQTINISDPHSPQLVSVFNTTQSCTINGQSVFYGNCGAGNIAISNDATTAFVPSSWNGLKVIDITNPKNPIELQTIIGTGDINTIGNVQLNKDGTLAYVVGNEGLSIFEVSDLYNIVLLGSYISSSIYGNNFSISDKGNLLYFSTTIGIQIIDVSDSSNPFKTDELYQAINQTTVQIYDIALLEKSGIAYAAAGTAGLQILNISSIPTPSTLLLILSGMLSFICTIKKSDKMNTRK